MSLPSPSPDAQDERRFAAVYRVRATAGTIEARASAIALEQSVELPLAAVRDARVRDEVVGRVDGIVPAGDERVAHDLRRHLDALLERERLGHAPGLAGRRDEAIGGEDARHVGNDQAAGSVGMLRGSRCRRRLSDIFATAPAAGGVPAGAMGARWL
jgi:hypothetical protein